MDDKQVVQEVQQKISWIKQHEIIIIAVLVLSTIGFLGNKWIDYSSKKADEKYVALQTELDQIKKDNAAKDAQFALERSKYQEQVNGLVKANQSLQANLNSREQAFQQQREVVQTMPLPKLATRLQELTGVQDTDIKIAESGVQLSDTGSRQTVTALEEIPKLKGDLEDYKKFTEVQKQVLAQAAQTIQSCQADVTGLKDQIAKADDTCKAQVDKVKADGRKSKRNWFIAGIATGGVIAAKIALMF